jgi:hypothetical protein
MGYRLRMSSEMRDWLTELRATDPSRASRVGESLIALMSEGDSLGPPVAESLAGPRRHEDPLEVLDYSYQARLDGLNGVRRRVADTAMLTRRVRSQIASGQALVRPPAARPGRRVSRGGGVRI